MFLAYKAITKKPKEFFINFWHQMNNSSLDSSSTVGQDSKSKVKENQSDLLNKIERISLISPKSLKRKESPVGSKKFEGYDIFFNMVTDLNYASITEMFERIIMSTFLLNCMEATRYFASEVNDDDSSSVSHETGPKIEDRVIFASLIFQAYSVILSNNHSVAEVSSLNDVKNDLNDAKAETSSFVGISRQVTGNCVFTRVASIFNHSCDPNTSPVYIDGKTQVFNGIFDQDVTKTYFLYGEYNLYAQNFLLYHPITGYGCNEVYC